MHQATSWFIIFGYIIFRRLVLTCFYAVELCHSVRAHGDIDFQRLQQITRMDPFSLMEDIGIKDEFFRLAGDILHLYFCFVDCCEQRQFDK